MLIRPRWRQSMPAVKDKQKFAGKVIGA